jgi:DNA-binding IclR family transcriptional regulator
MKSLANALRLYGLFTDQRKDWSVGELAAHTGMPKSQCSKILAEFRDAHFLRQDPVTRRYSVGIRSFVIGSQYLIQDNFTRQAMPLMAELTDRSGHSARLVVRDGDLLVYLLVTNSPDLVESGWRAGAVLPWHATSAGRIMLAYMAPDERDRLLATSRLEAVNPRTTTDRAAIDQAIDRARLAGFATARGEATPGLGAISVPVLGPDLRVIAALGLAFPEHAVGPSEEQPLVTLLHEAAKRLSQRAGAAAYSIPPRTPAASQAPAGAAAAADPAAGS